jgi:glycosyltransferase involved in cell wall biosynthesis
MPAGAGATVFVTAFRRRSYLLEAARSAVRGGSNFPISLVVATDFVDPHIDRQLETMGAVVLHPRSSRLGEWILEARSHFQGEIVAFLDDDDLFVPGKIEAVYHRFQARGDLLYLHNAHRVFSEGDRMPTFHAPARSMLRKVEVFSQPDQRTIEGLWNLGVAFNHSSITIRRGLLDRLTAELGEMRSSFGPLFFFGSLVEYGAVGFDHTIWTLVRRHSLNSSDWSAGGRRQKWERRFRLLKDRQAEVDAILRMVESKGAELWTGPLRRSHARQEMMRGWVSIDLPIRRRLRDIFKWMRVAAWQDSRTDPDLLLGAIMNVVLPFPIFTKIFPFDPSLG